MSAKSLSEGSGCSSDLSTTPVTTQKRRTLTPQEKMEAVHRVLRGETKASVARSLKVPESTLRGWCKKAEGTVQDAGTPLQRHAINIHNVEQNYLLFYNQIRNVQTSDDQPLDYRKKVLDAKLKSEIAMAQASIDTVHIDRILEEEWHRFLRNKLQQKELENAYQLMARMSQAGLAENETQMNYWYNCLYQSYVNSQIHQHGQEDDVNKIEDGEEGNSREEINTEKDENML